MHLFHSYEEVDRAELEHKNSPGELCWYAVLQRCKVCGKERGIYIFGGITLRTKYTSPRGT